MGLSQPPEGPHLRQTDRDSVHTCVRPVAADFSHTCLGQGFCRILWTLNINGKDFRERTSFGSVNGSRDGPKPGAWRVGRGVG